MKYFNFPIRMMQDILYSDEEKKKNFLSDVLYFAIYSHSLSIEDLNEYEETEAQRVKRSASWFNVTVGSIGAAISTGASLVRTHESSKVYTGLNTNIFWDFYKGAKTDFEWECLFAHLALKSILEKKEYVKTDNLMLYARMAGLELKKEYEKLKGFNFSRYHRDKIVSKLEMDWGLKYYSRYTRGFYCGYEVDIEKLIFIAENNKEAIKKEFLKKQKTEILKKFHDSRK
ncbi:hypothetical protein M2T70_04780 [Elizabethkingia anophelis]|uniref:hypothetical protein n=1 Tax=Elizabethkingia anophelis TaxID=1117645 RepID=UPI000CFD71C5|nr:hypothetical protein [Elizabethkingia anophelis]ASV77952.2 hypothetical protein A6J37_04580 [Elizabethkingia anophelis]MCL1648259.1 hypothetical protein [Elizabethkingia anophelis]MCL1683653.1 hypothetical protein [Elizabethkingia anophelis]MDV3460761.1 hypothetical protein [Elizabethkingia anophelis]MDV3667971.1 hypothetical protein [Elizabethkingia anophelis]